MKLPLVNWAQLIQKRPQSQNHDISSSKDPRRSTKAQIGNHYVKVFKDDCFRLTFHIGTDDHEFCPNWEKSKILPVNDNFW